MIWYLSTITEKINTEMVDMEAAVSLEPAVKGLMKDKLIWHDKQQSARMEL